MSLFRVNGQSLKFDIVGLDEHDLFNIKKIILENGGIIEQNDKQPIKFTRPKKYVTHAFRSYKLYDIKFITDCQKKGIILDPSPYRIGTPMLYDNCVMYHFLHRVDSCCTHKFPTGTIKTENASNSGSDNQMSDGQPISEDDSHSDQSDSRVNGLTNGNGSRSSKNTGRSNRDYESETSSISMPEDYDSGAPRASTSTESRKGPGFRYSHKGRGQKISQAEREAMVKFLADNRLIGEALGGLQVWKEIIRNGICANRTPNSLYRHFRKYILPNIEAYDLTERQLQRFKRLS